MRNLIAIFLIIPSLSFYGSELSTKEDPPSTLAENCAAISIHDDYIIWKKNQDKLYKEAKTIVEKACGKVLKEEGYYQTFFVDYLLWKNYVNSQLKVILKNN